MSSYIFDNAAEEPTTQRFASLEALYDPRTIRFLEATGVGPGWRCLEVGGGSGSIAAWLADRVGGAGHVLVTDIDPRFLAGLAAAEAMGEVRRPWNVANESGRLHVPEQIEARLRIPVA